MLWGIEFEYLIVDTTGPSAGRVRDFTNLSFESISTLLEPLRRRRLWSSTLTEKDPLALTEGVPPSAQWMTAERS